MCLKSIDKKKIGYREHEKTFTFPKKINPKKVNYNQTIRAYNRLKRLAQSYVN